MVKKIIERANNETLAIVFLGIGLLIATVQGQYELSALIIGIFGGGKINSGKK